MDTGHHGLRGRVALLLVEVVLTLELVHVPILLLNTKAMIALRTEDLTQRSKTAILEHAVSVLTRLQKEFHIICNNLYATLDVIINTVK